MNNNQFEEQSVDSGTEHSPINNFEAKPIEVPTSHPMDAYQGIEPPMIMTSSHHSPQDQLKLMNPALNPHAVLGQAGHPMMTHQVSIASIISAAIVNLSPLGS